MTATPSATPQSLVAAFERIAVTRMADMPLCNRALSVEAVGFREWNGRQAGVLISPWAISLVVLPGQSNDVEPLPLDRRKSWCFPDGEYDFMGGNEAECGPFHFCSLFSPPSEIPDQQQARDIALAVMHQLFAPQVAQTAQPAQKVSRRALLTGAMPPAV